MRSGRFFRVYLGAFAGHFALRRAKTGQLLGAR
jgi:hypothetical protein